MNPRPAPFALLLALAALSGCAVSDDGSLDAQAGAAAPTCLVHQAKAPGSRYTASERADTKSVLERMRYYTANGTKDFCDGRPATGTDRRWTDLYTALGGDRAHLAATARTP
ncbi:hypothetical protein OG689_00740 [Kitasatospora sp. NBC_00240]|uniref:hypothetical protein n=1 Tax=Kitasatospora sp. NBC_00240 TaxID=2903567 RepID=UPI002255CB0D|nr:hypothetical protein [Kitasatospora sp. NBC_00240]MCX5207860.1 hypothetical protein [Kitasatospora sp. NBC_00240]